MSEAYAPRALPRRAWAANPPLAGAAIVLLLITLATLVGLIVDPGELTGQPTWAKPARFGFSFALYAVTLLWLLTFVRGHSRLVRVISWATATGVVAEVLWVAGSAMAGRTSHFNHSSSASTALLVTMLTIIVVVGLMAVLTLGLLLRQRVEPPALAWALRLGLVLAVMGMATGALMVTPNAAQEAAADLGQGMPIIGAHTVGLPDGGPGLPVTNFSTAAGDLRVPHFVGTHSLQALCLLGLLLTLGPRVLGQRHRTALVWIAAAFFLGLIALLTWQARRAQPFTAPDARTATAYLVLTVAAAAAVTAVFRHARRATAARETL
ncbi:hypothetical protein GCM10010232_10910 [Streptomyces amakusaensis]|uniref:Integral membrane protein n=1 Tax=Streptomyces amakusaensis TaxID=67271 RepID=A0ABW0ABN0_9ACTN